LVGPDAISPVIPLSSSNPRRGDNLVLEYGDLLFDRLRIDSLDFMYVPEDNPFEVYSSLFRTISRYGEAFKPLGGCKVTLSALSSKLVSMGALLASYVLKYEGGGVGIAQVETRGYKIERNWDEELLGKLREKSEMSTMWLAGVPYV
jgi:hypothetical protein